MLMSTVDLREMRARRVKRVFIRVAAAIVQATLAGISVWAICKIIVND